MQCVDSCPMNLTYTPQGQLISNYGNWLHTPNYEHIETFKEKLTVGYKWDDPYKNLRPMKIIDYLRTAPLTR